MIQWLLVSVGLLSMFILWRSLRTEKESFDFVEKDDSGKTSDSSVQPDLTLFEEKLKSLIDKMGPVVGATKGAEGASGLAEENQKLRGEVEILKTKLAQVEGASPQAPASDSELAQRVKELETKLKEYEILEDDIADLSLFKEENTKLKAELEALKGGVASAPSPEENADLVAEFAAAVEHEKRGANEAEEKNEEKVEETVDEKVAETVEEKNEEKVEEKVEEQSETESNLLAEFSQEISAATSDPLSIPIDTDKMLAEVEDLPPGEEGQGLDEAIDTEKMASEAGQLVEKGSS